MKLRPITGREDSLSAEDEAVAMFAPESKQHVFTESEAYDDSWRPNVFICYSQRDDKSREILETHLKFLRTQGLINETWTDQILDPGEDWDQRIKSRLDQADVILILVSTAALATDFIRKVEMTRALERHASGKALVVSIILEQCGWQKTELAKWQVIQPHRKPVLDNKPQRNGWAVVAEMLHDLFKRMCRERVAG